MSWRLPTSIKEMEMKGHGHDDPSMGISLYLNFDDDIETQQVSLQQLLNRSRIGSKPGADEASVPSRNVISTCTSWGSEMGMDVYRWRWRNRTFQSSFSINLTNDWDIQFDKDLSHNFHFALALCGRHLAEHNPLENNDASVIQEKSLIRVLILIPLQL